VAVRSRLVAVVAFVCALVMLVPVTGASTAPMAAQAPEAASAVTPAVSHLLTNSRENPLGIGGEDPQLSWQMNAERRGVTQAAYQVRVATTPEALASPDVWDSGKVDSARSVDVVYDGPALRSHTMYQWSVRVWDDTGTASAWSEPATFETGLLSPEEWTGDWIGADAAGIGPEWTDYTVDFTASDIDQALGVYFRGSDTEHAYMWQISEAQGSLRPHVKNGGYHVLPAMSFPDGFDFAAAHDYRITVEGQTISFYVDDELLDRRTDTVHTAPGVIGFRTSGEERGRVHHVTITSADGAVLIDTTFPAGDRTFTAGTVTDGNLLVSGNAEAWYPVPDDVPLLRNGFTVADKAITNARIYASA
jgi:alpha-L-rhamnosidase